MRKFILPILVAGAVAFTAAQAFAGANTHTGSFQEDHATANTLTVGTVTTSLTDATPEGDHYKVTTATEAGAHGGDFGGWQLDSSYLKSMADGTFDGDTAWGYTTGANPFVMGEALITQPDPSNSDTIMPAPAYTLPCPVFSAELAINGGLKGDCGANINADDPQTENPEAIWDGTVLDDLYQVVGVDDSTVGTGYNRILDQTLDQLFYSGKRGKVEYMSGDNTVTSSETFSEGKIGATIVPGTGRIFNIDDTLDQDLADYNVNVLEGTTVGIFNKLIMNFQLAGKQMTTGDMAAIGITTTTLFGLPGTTGAGCSSWGGGHGGGEDTCKATVDGEELGGTTWYDIMSDKTDVATMTAIWGANNNNFAAVMIEQWLDAEVYDWDATTADPKLQGIGMKQELSTYFRDGSNKKYNYSTGITTGHGTVTKTIALPDHSTIDP